MMVRESTEWKMSLPGFRLVAANIEEIADKALERVMVQQITPAMKLPPKPAPDQMLTEQGEAYTNQVRRNQYIVDLLGRLRRTAPETYKLWPWLARAWKKGRGNQGDPALNPFQHVLDILRSATMHLDRLRDDPRPDVSVPDVMREFVGFNELEAWVYEQNAANRVMEDEKDQVVFEYGDGWTIKQLHADNLGWEGEEMGHCVGGYCRYVEAGDTIILSLRDPKNQPHVTIEVSGQKTKTPENAFDPPAQVVPMGPSEKSWQVVQIQGKQDTEPVDEYKDRLRTFFMAQREGGTNFEWSPNAWRPGGGYDDDTRYVDSATDLLEWWEDIGGQPPVPADDDPEFDEYGLPLKTNWGGFEFSPDTALNDILEGLIPEDVYNSHAPYRRDMPELLASYLAAAEHANIGKQEMEAAIEVGYNWIDQKRDDYRDQNWDYEHQMVKDWMEGDDPELDFDEWYQTQDDPWMDERYEKAMEEVEKTWDEPYKWCYEFLSELSTALTGQRPPVEQEPPHVTDMLQGVEPVIPVERGIPGALGSWLMPSKRYGFLMVAADIAELAERQRNNLLQRQDIRELPNRDKNYLHNLLEMIHDENYKLMPWAVREWKRSRMPVQGTAGGTSLGDPTPHALDIINQAGRWLNWLDEYNRPGVDYMNKQFTFENMQEWVYEMNAAQSGGEEGPEDPNRVQWQEETRVYEFPNGWYIAVVGADDAPQEGQLMGHCVGGYCHQIRSGQSYIYSLRDEKGAPHVTLESHDPLHNTDNSEGNIVQIFGKSDAEPIPEYKAMIRDWFQYLQNTENMQIQWAEDAVGYAGGGYDDYQEPYYNYDASMSVSVTDLEDVIKAYELIKSEGIGSFQEDNYTGHYVDDPEGNNDFDEAYGIEGTNRQVEEVIPANFIDLQRGQYGGGNEPTKFLLELWREFLENAKMGQYDREQIEEYVEAFYFIPKTDENQGRYMDLPGAQDYVIEGRKLHIAPEQGQLPFPSVYNDPTSEEQAELAAEPWDQYQVPEWGYQDVPVETPRGPGETAPSAQPGMTRQRVRNWELQPTEVTEENPYVDYALWYMASLEQGFSEKNPYYDPEYNRQQFHQRPYQDPWYLEDSTTPYATRPGRPQYPGVLPGALTKNFIHEYSAARKSIVITNIRTGAVVAEIPANRFWGVESRNGTWKFAYDELNGNVNVMPHQTVQEALRADPAARAAYEALSRAGGHVYAVGGAVRDAFLGKPSKDIDLMVVGLPADEVEAVLSTVGRVDLTGKNFGVFRLKAGGSEVEVALPRTEYSTGGGHKDFSITVDHTLDPEDDLLRRDFTGNAMALNLDSGEILDPFGGQADLSSRTLRTVSPDSFRDDPLRTIRALVQQARHGLRPDADTMEQMREFAPQIRHLPGERIQAELDKLLSSDDPVTALRIADESDVLDYMLPEVATTRGVDQMNPHHDLPVNEHLYEVLSHMVNISNDPDLRLAALLHDIGKPDSMWVDDQGHGHFYEHPDYPNSADHDKLGAEYAEAMMRRLRYPNDRIERVKKLIELHMFPAFKTKKQARRFLNRAGSEKMAWDLIRLRMADYSGKRGGMNTQESEEVKTMMELLHQVVDEQPAVSVKELAIDGHKLQQVGIKPGPQMGQILRDLLDLVIDRPELNNESDLLQLARQMADERRDRTGKREEAPRDGGADRWSDLVRDSA